MPGLKPVHRFRSFKAFSGRSVGALREAPLRRPKLITPGGDSDDEIVRRHDGLWPLFLVEYRDHVLQKAVELRRVAAVCLCLAVIAILAAACDGNRATQTPVDTPAPTNAPTPAEIPTPTDTPLPTLAPTPTVEVHPTATPTADVLAGFSPPDPVDGVGDVHEAFIGGQRFRLEVARTPVERARGLMNRESLARDSAMIFVYPQEDYRGFWMKNTLIPLDILLLDSRGIVVDVQTMTPQIGAPDSELTEYRSASPARYAIEMNAGMARELGIESGEQALFR